ncbi:recombination mediator protein UvsY [bacterium]|nr:recombination mediator protein UvsY [bacterium]
MISNTDDISEIWAVDCKIDESNLGGESKKIPELHNKYYTLYYKEALKVKKLKYDYKELELNKREWLDGSMAEEDLKDLGWKPNPRKIIRQDIDKHIQADKDVIRLSLRIDYHSARANFLEDIIKTIHSRNFIIKSMIDILKFQHGEY